MPQLSLANPWFHNNQPNRSQRDDPDIQLNQQINIGAMSAVEAGMRVAYALHLALHAQRELEEQREKLL